MGKKGGDYVLASLFLHPWHGNCVRCDRWLSELEMIKAAVFVLAVFFSVVAKAESISAVEKTQEAELVSYSGTIIGTSTQVITKTASELCPQLSPGRTVKEITSDACIYTDNIVWPITPKYACGTSSDRWPYTCRVWSCPDASYTLSGQTCSRPDCAQGEVRQLDGTCKPENACIGKKGQTVNQTYAAIGDPNVGKDYCIGGCYAALKTVSPIKSVCAFNNTGQGFCGQVRDWSAVYTGLTCTGDSDAPPTGEKKVESKKPPCDAGQGVLTSTSGTVACVPEGTPDAAKPKVEKSVSTETYPDGTQKTTETQTTIDPDTGAKTRTTTTTSQGGQSGSPGTQTGVEEQTGSNPASGAGTCTGANCGAGGQGGVGKFPGTGDLYTKGEKTVSSVIQSFADGVKGSGLGVAVGNYFKLSGGSGGCPSWSVNVEFLKTNLDIGQYFCNPTAISYLQLFGNVLMIVVSFVAFRWAIL